MLKQPQSISYGYKQIIIAHIKCALGPTQYTTKYAPIATYMHDETTQIWRCLEKVEISVGFMVSVDLSSPGKSAPLYLSDLMR